MGNNNFNNILDVLCSICTFNNGCLYRIIQGFDMGLFKAKIKYYNSLGLFKAKNK